MLKLVVELDGLGDQYLREQCRQGNVLGSPASAATGLDGLLIHLAAICASSIGVPEHSRGVWRRLGRSIARGRTEWHSNTTHHRDLDRARGSPECCAMAWSSPRVTTACSEA